jgi:hypothetical protein
MSPRKENRHDDIFFSPLATGVLYLIVMSNTRRRNSSNNDGPQGIRERSRVVAEREASRLARPDQPSASGTLGHASRARSSVASTPFGQMMGGRSPPGRKSNPGHQDWCGPFSVARQMIAAREEARRLREEQLAENDPSNSKESHPLDEVTEAALEKKRRLENPSMNWVSRRQRANNSPTNGDATRVSYYASRRQRFNQQKILGNGGSIVSLFQLCVNCL